MSPWLRVLEAYLVQSLLRTPAFHRGVEKVVKTIYRVRHGLPPEEMGGTKIDQPGQSGFMKHFYDEVRTQIGAAEQRGAASGPGARVRNDAVPVKTEAPKVTGEETSDAAWKNAQTNASRPQGLGFMGEYLGALREQVRNGKNRQ